MTNGVHGALRIIQTALVDYGIEPAHAAILARVVLSALVGTRLPTAAQVDLERVDSMIHALFHRIGVEGCRARFGLSRAAIYRAIHRARQSKREYPTAA